MDAFNRDIHKKLNHKGIWDIVITAIVCLVMMTIIAMSFKAKKIFKKQKKNLKEIRESTVTKIELKNSSTKFSNFFLDLDERTQRTLLICSEIMKRDWEVVYNRMIEAARDKGMTLTLEDMPEILLTYLDQTETEEVIKEINFRPNEEEDNQTSRT